jgi:hypothetical protein
MKNHPSEFISEYISKLQISKNISRLAYQVGNALYLNNQCVLQSREGEHFAYTVEDNYQDFNTDIFYDIEEKKIEIQCNCNAEGFCSHKVSSLLQLHEDLSQEVDQEEKVGMKYTRDGMIKRVMAERQEKAVKEKFQLEFADNIYGEHLIYNQRNTFYKLTFYDFEKKLGYCSCPDHQTNKLGSCKHLIYAFDAFDKHFQDKAIPAQDFPFLEIFLHPLKDYRISWFYPGPLNHDIKALLSQYFDKEQLFTSRDLIHFQSFIQKAQRYKFIKIRPEVLAKIKKEKEKNALLELKQNTHLNFESLNFNLYPYQKEGVEFLVFNKGAILADEVGLGKTIQAIVAAHFKKELFNLQSVLIVCPNSLIHHWENEIKKTGISKFSLIEKETDFYQKTNDFKLISFTNFSKFAKAFKTYSPDILIIDEAQKISNFNSDLVHIIKQVKRRHLLIITDSQPENHLMQFYTMVGLIDNTVLTPLWEFSYQHCLFDSQVLDKVVGYYNQEHIANKIQSILIRREKKEVFNQLQKINRLRVPVNLNQSQQEQQQRQISEALFLLNKKLKTRFDWQNIASQLKEMKALSSQVLFSNQNHDASAKFQEFKHFLLEKINLNLNSQKIIVFAEKDESRKQLAHFFRENKTAVHLLKYSQSEEEREACFYRFRQDKKSAVIILREGQAERLPEASVFIYYDFSLDQNAVENRYIRLQQQSVANPPSIIHFISQDALENGFFRLQEEKPLIYEEIADFLIQSDQEAELSREAQSKIKTILQSLQSEEIDNDKSQKSRQTQLFGTDSNQQNISLSGEEHKAFEINAAKQKVESAKIIDQDKAEETLKIKKILHDAHVLVAGLYALQNPEGLPWKEEDIDLKINDREIILKIKRHP